MNQILITKKLYVTPELKKKKKIYKVYFIISIFLVIALLSFYISTEYARAKEESVSQDILNNININKDDTVADNDMLVIFLDKEAAEEANKRSVENGQGNTSGELTNKKTIVASDGQEYSAIATIYIPSIDVTYPILLSPEQTTESIEETLKVAPTKFWGPEPNEVGNFCIVGHNYRNTKFFSKVPTMENGEIIEITDLNGRAINYKVYDKYTVDPTDVSCTSQLTNGKKEVTLITCTDDSELRVIIKAREVK